MQTITLPAGRQSNANALRFFERLPTDSAWRVVVEPYKPRRSESQNRYLWGVVYPTILKAGNLDGWEPEDLHEFYLGECFGWETLEGMGRKRVKPLKRSSKLNKTEFSDYVGFIQRKAAEMGIYIPDPEDV